MNALEANLLDRSIGRFGDTLLQNRMMSEQQKERELQRAMRGEELAFQREQAGTANTFRERSLQQQGEATRSLDEYRKAMTEAKGEEEKLKLWSEMLKSGVLGPEGLDAMSKAMSDKLGVQVILKMPEADAEPKVWEDKHSGRRWAYRPGSKELHDLTPNVGEAVEETDPLTGEVKQRIRRKLTPADLKAAMEGRQVVDEAAGPTADQEAEIEEIMSRPAVNASQPAADIKRKIGRITAMQEAPAIEGAGAAGEMPVFANEMEARAKGYKAGDIVRLRLNGKPTRVRLK